MNLHIESEDLAFPKRKKAAVKAKAKPVADKHRPAPDMYEEVPALSFNTKDMLDRMRLDELLSHQQAVNDLVASRRAMRLATLQAEAAALGAKVSMPGKGKGKPRRSSIATSTATPGRVEACSRTG